MIEKISSLVSFHSTLSSRLGLSLLPWIVKSNLSTSSTSQSLKGLENLGLQTPSSPEESHYSTNQASLKAAKAYKEGKELQRAKLPHHLSFQNFTFLPSPTENTTLFCIRDPSFLISFQKPTPKPSLTSLVYQPPSSSPNFLLITCFQRVFYESMIYWNTQNSFKPSSVFNANKLITHK